MGKRLSITVHPSAPGAEYLTVSDAMRQVLDVVEVLERTEAADACDRQIVWRLTEAHTNSPPFTVTAEAFPTNPTISVGLEAARVTAAFGRGFRELLDGLGTPWIDPEIAAPIKRALHRNLNGVGRTEIAIEDEEPFNIVPKNAKAAVIALERLELDIEATTPDHSRTEYGSLEVEVFGITRWNDKPALTVTDRLSRERVTCVLSSDLAKQLGPTHRWYEAWEGRRLLVSGALQFGPDGSLKRIDGETAEDVRWTDVPVSDLRGIDVLQGRTVAEHLERIRGGNVG